MRKVEEIKEEKQKEMNVPRLTSLSRNCLFYVEQNEAGTHIVIICSFALFYISFIQERGLWVELYVLKYFFNCLLLLQRDTMYQHLFSPKSDLLCGYKKETTMLSFIYSRTILICLTYGLETSWRNVVGGMAERCYQNMFVLQLETETVVCSG